MQEQGTAAGGRRLKNTLVRSVIGYRESQRLVVKSLGLRRIRQSVIHHDTPSIQGMLKNGMAIVPLLTLGAVASLTGVEPVFVLLPFALALIVGVLIRLSYRYTGREIPPRGEILRTLVTEPGASNSQSPPRPATPVAEPPPRPRRYRRRE